MPQILSAKFAAFDEFLAPFELDELLQFTAGHEADFHVSEVVTPGFDGGKVDFDWRRSSVLTDLVAQQAVLAERIQSCLPAILEKLELEPFPVSRIEAQITASNDGDYFRWHTDNGHPETASRAITFVYFFHREPSQFQGGELRLYDAEWHDDCYYPLENYKVVIPKQNRAAFFVSALPHEVTAVECPSGAFADSRFTLNGWLHR